MITCDYYRRGKCINKKYKDLKKEFKNSKYKCYFKKNQGRCPFSD